ncbi:MAG TPA: hypothetical protein VHM30_18160 [Gemmatimonadaceae bacterium]|nr:hypothetical protein [Gemmatimonadaceae bacterium]
MNRPHLFAQLYGYAVCLTAVIVGLVGGSGVVNAAFDLSDPVHAKQGWGNDVPATFEEFRADQRGQLGAERDEPAPPSRDSARATSRLTDDELRRIYESRRDEIIATRRFQATKNLVGSALLLVAAIALFTWHWRWLRHLPDVTTTPAT